ncbi:MAG: YciI family protein [Chitinophagales bacterium]
MKRIIASSLVILLVTQAAFSQKDSTSKMPEPQIRQYWFVLLTPGNNRSQDSVTAAKIQMGHLGNIRKLYLEGKIKVAGPFGEEGDPITTGWQGIFIFDCPTRDEVEKLLKTDPAIAAGRMIYHIKPWYTVPTGSFEPGKPKASLF